MQAYIAIWSVLKSSWKVSVSLRLSNNVTFESGLVFSDVNYQKDNWFGAFLWALLSLVPSEGQENVVFPSNSVHCMVDLTLIVSIVLFLVF